MFLNTCAVCATRVLIFPSQITSVANTADGIELRFTCWCGTGQTRMTGRAAGSSREPALTA